MECISQNIEIVQQHRQGFAIRQEKKEKKKKENHHRLILLTSVALGYGCYILV